MTKHNSELTLKQSKESLITQLKDTRKELNILLRRCQDIELNHTQQHLLKKTALELELMALKIEDVASDILEWVKVIEENPAQYQDTRMQVSPVNEQITDFKGQLN